MNPPTDPVAACTHPDPYPYYASLPPSAWDEGLRAWVLSSAEAVAGALASPQLRVRPPGQPVPAAIAGSPAGELFAGLARMNDGDRHHRLRQPLAEALDRLDPSALRERAGHWTRVLWGRERASFEIAVRTMAEALGVPEPSLARVSEDIGELVRGVAPGATAAQVEKGIEAAARLRGAFADISVIALLFQAHDASAGLIGNAIVALGRGKAREGDPAGVVDQVMRLDPPVQNTRRWVAEPCIVAGQRMREGEPVLLLLAATGMGFGSGAHHCPGSAAARAAATGALEALIEMNADFAAIADGHDYHPSINCRIPRFRRSGLR